MPNDNHQKFYKLYVRQSKLMQRKEDEFKVYLQLYRKSIVTVVVNANFNIQYALEGTTRAMSKSYSPGLPKW